MLCGVARRAAWADQGALQIETMARVVLVEPDSALRQWCRLHLESQRLSVAAFDDVRPALQATRLEATDLVIIATDMPAGGAFALAAAIRSNVRTALVPILFLVPSNDPEAFAHAISIAPQGAVSKPVTRAVLLHSVAVSLGQPNEVSTGREDSVPTHSTVERHSAATLPTGAGLVLDARHSTVLVTVLRNFISLARALNVRTLDSLLRRFTVAARDAILEHEGWIVRADATELVALFEDVPKADRSHATRAVESALAVLVAARRAKAQATQELGNVSVPDLSVGCGIHTGEVVLARLSAASHLGLTLAGQTADLAHRLNGRAKGLGWSIAASESTVAAAGARFQFGRRSNLTDVDHDITLGLSEVLGPNPGTARPGELPFMAEIREAVLANTMLAKLAGDVDQSTADRTIMVRDKLEPEDQTLPDRRVVRRVGKRRYAHTYLTSHLSTGREEIVKTVLLRELPPRFVDAYLEQYQKLSNVEQRNVAAVYEVGRIAQGGYVALEYLPGGELTEAIRKKVPVGFALNCLAQMCLALDGIHDAGIVHGALRAEHFLFRQDRVLVLTDFNITEQVSDALGLAHPVGGNARPRPKAGPAAPQPGPRVDFQALGRMLYAMLIGEASALTKPDQELSTGDLFRATRLPLGLSPLQPCLDALLGADPTRSVDRAEDVLVELLSLKEVFPFDIRIPDPPSAAHSRKHGTG
jgi:class 3 adenylate cyclase